MARVYVVVVVAVVVVVVRVVGILGTSSVHRQRCVCHLRVRHCYHHFA